MRAAWLTVLSWCINTGTRSKASPTSGLTPPRSAFGHASVSPPPLTLLSSLQLASWNERRFEIVVAAAAAAASAC